MTAAPRCPQNGNKSLSTLSAAGEPRAGSQPAPRAHTSPENIPSAAGRAWPGRPRTISGLAPASKAHAGLFQIFPPLPLTFLHSARPPLLTHSLLSFLPQNKQPSQCVSGSQLPAPGTSLACGGCASGRGGPGEDCSRRAEGGCGLRRGHRALLPNQDLARGHISNVSWTRAFPPRSQGHTLHRVCPCQRWGFCGHSAAEVSHPHPQPEVHAQHQHPQVSPGDMALSPGPAPRGGGVEGAGRGI